MLSRGEVNPIGRLLVIDFDQYEEEIFERIIDVLKEYPEFERYELPSETKFSISGLEIDYSRRKVDYEGNEIVLTLKEYKLLNLFLANRGKVLTYEQIYQKVWDDFYQDIENNSISAHVCSLRNKLKIAGVKLQIQCIREVGYCMDITRI